MSRSHLFVLFMITVTSALPVRADQQESLKIGVLGQDTLDFFPRRQQPGRSHFVRELLSPPMVIMNEKWNWTCTICDDIPTTENGQVRVNTKAKFPFITEWRLKPNLKWSDGKPITADDIKFTMNLLFRQSREENSPHLPLFKVDIHPKDKLKFYISFKEPRYDYFQIMALSLLPAHKQDDIEKITNMLDSTKDLNQISKLLESEGLYYGPYFVKNLNASEIHLQRNLHYSDDPDGYEEIKIIYKKSRSLLENELKVGRIDMVAEGNFSTDQAINLAEKHSFVATNFRIISSPSSYLDQLIVNMRNPYLSDINMRKALLIAIDRDKLLQGVYHGHGRAAYDLLPTIGKESSLRMFPFNPDHARSLLDNLGWEQTESGIRYRHGQPLQIEIVAKQVANDKETAQFIQEDWKAIGIDVRLNFFEPREYAERILKPKRFRDVALVSISHMPHTYWFGRFHSQSIPEEGNFFEGMNFGNWQNKTIDQLLGSYQKTYDLFAMWQTSNRIQAEIYKHLPIFPLVFQPKLMLVRDTIGNVRLSGHHFHSSLYSAEWTNMKKEAEMF
ncbi:MAG: ABC transporter substrate-binding protein [Oligoflexus sp.]